MPNIRYNQEMLIGDQVTNVDRREVLLDQTWNLVKTVCVLLAGLLLLWLAYQLGQMNPDCAADCNKSTVVAVPAPVSLPAATLPAVTDRIASALEKIAEAKPSTATATSSAEVKTIPPPPTVVVKVVEVPASVQPPITRTELTTQTPAVVDPIASMTPAERCNYEIIRLRRARCSQ